MKKEWFLKKFEAKETELKKSPAPFIPNEEGAFAKGKVKAIVNYDAHPESTKKTKTVMLPNGLRYERHERKASAKMPGGTFHLLFHPKHQDPVAAIETYHNHNDYNTKYQQAAGVDSVHGDHTVRTSKVDEEHKGKGYGKQLYSAILAHHVPQGNKLWSDGQVSPKAHAAWKSFRGKPGVSGYIGRYPKNPNRSDVQEGSYNHDELKEHPHFLINDNQEEIASSPEHFPAVKGLHFSDPYADKQGGRLAKADETQAPKHNDTIRQVAQSYADKKGFKLDHAATKLKIDPNHSTKLAQAYEGMKHDPAHPQVRRAYDALINETSDQFHHIKSTGLKFSKIKPDMQNPYKNSKDLHEDLKNNNHMWYYPTEQGFGSGDPGKDHPLMRQTDHKDNEGQFMPANDVFRIVHDYFGHGKEGFGFGAAGEENAWAHHSKMFSPDAQKALTSETRGQNSWVNFGPHGKANQANPSKTVYAQQKAGLLPDWALNHEQKDLLGKSEITLSKGEKGDWKKEGYTHKVHPPKVEMFNGKHDITEHKITAHNKDGHRVGSYHFSEWPEASEHKGLLHTTFSGTDPDHQRKGLATEAYKLIEHHTGKKVHSANGNRSEDAKKFWSQKNKPFGKSEELEKAVNSPSKHIGLARLKQIKQDHNQGAGGQEYDEQELHNAINERSNAHAEKMVRDAKRNEHKHPNEGKADYSWMFKQKMAKGEPLGLSKSNYKGGGISQYNAADNARRKQTQNTSSQTETGIQGIKVKVGANVGGEQGKDKLNREAKELAAKNRKQPVNKPQLSDTEKAKINAEMTLRALKQNPKNKLAASEQMYLSKMSKSEPLGLSKGEKGDWQKEGYKLSYHPHQNDESYFKIHAHDKTGKHVGTAEFTHHDDGKHIRSYDDGQKYEDANVSVNVHHEHRRKGLATAMYQHAEKSTGKKLKNVGKNKRTSDGQALWAQKNKPFGTK